MAGLPVPSVLHYLYWARHEEIDTQSRGASNHVCHETAHVHPRHGLTIKILISDIDYITQQRQENITFCTVIAAHSKGITCILHKTTGRYFKQFYYIIM